MVEIRNIHKYFGTGHVIRGINLEVKRGELLTVIGRSGCGKTTLLRLINCLEIPDSGYIRVGETSFETIESKLEKFTKKKQLTNDNEQLKFLIKFNDDGKEIPFKTRLRELRTSVGMLFQNLNLFPHLTTIENVALAPKIIKNKAQDDALHLAETLLDKVGLKSLVHRYPHELSGGQAQRVAIARALAINPYVMMYDEPTSALDPEIVGEVVEVMKQLHKEGMTQIVVTHSMEFAQALSDQVAYMDSGMIIEKDVPDKLFNHPKDERTKNYLAKMLGALQVK